MNTAAGGESTYVLRVQTDPARTSFVGIASAMEEAGGQVVSMEVTERDPRYIFYQVEVQVEYDQLEALVKSVEALAGVEKAEAIDSTFFLHLGGKLTTELKSPIRDHSDLSKVYTPGVARVCMAIHEDRQQAYNYTIKKNTVAVISDGTAVLGLGDIGPEAAMPVMEGKAALFKRFANVDSFPICLDTKDTDEIVNIIKAIAPAFGGINLEDISAPRCFEIEERLKQELDIPVFHDDQHGTAVVMLAGLYNALKIVGKKLEDLKVVVAGAGAAGVACSKILLEAGVTNLIGVASSGAIHKDGEYTRYNHRWFAENTNPHNLKGSLSDVIEGADVFIGVSSPDILTVEDIKKMAKDPIVFAMSNPNPEIKPELARPHVRILATGRSDYPNQINNVLCFPGIFRGALDCQAREINEAMKLAAARAIASVISDEELHEEYIIPSAFNPHVVEKVREAVMQAAYESGATKRNAVPQA